MKDTYEGDEYPAEYECRTCGMLVYLPEGVGEPDAGLRYCGPCAVAQIEQLRLENTDLRAKLSDAAVENARDAGQRLRIALQLDEDKRNLESKLANYASQIEALMKQRDMARNERDRYDTELSAVAAILQEALPIGKVKHIGIMEVAAGVGEVVKQRDDARAKVDAFANARDEAVKDGVFWKERCDELAAALSCYMGKFGNCGPTYDRAKAAVEAVEKAREK